MFIETRYIAILITILSSMVTAAPILTFYYETVLAVLLLSAFGRSWPELSAVLFFRLCMYLAHTYELGFVRFHPHSIKQ